ncbi:HlyD family secretion protein [Aquabacterium sp. CECT 9606]|uniref:HlyD family secretion protein n=1 Tax=Aquabacterium sp. CECT 9606 TaxID=2845822 RepID=UPI001E29D76E|nr:HlyD family secretion protein [Aquabacterium sp. CECT 9606]CAH0351661.1 Colistin resistance protein EmrA [Aquabacterium sp. CECT 9606]
MQNPAKTEPVTLVATNPAGSAAVQPAEKPPSKVRVFGVLGVLILAGLGFGGRMYWRSQNFVETENAYVAGHVHPISARISGVVTKVLVDDNQIVKEGQVIAELDPADQGVKLEQIRAQIASVEQQVLQADAQTAQARASASAAQAQVAQAQALSLRAQQDAERYGQLYNTQMKAVAKSELDAANAARTGALADVAARKDAALAAQAQVGAAQAAREVLKAQIKVLQAQAKDAQLQVTYNRIVAPVSGRLGKRNVEVGARVQAGQQLAAIVEDKVWVTANFKETQLAGLKPGQEVDVVIDALPGQHLKARLDSFSPASGNQFALLPADNATGNFTKIVQRVPVKLTLADADLQRLAGRLAPGMSALAEVDLRQSPDAQR